MADITAPVSTETIPTELPTKGLLRAKQILPFIGISKSTLWEWSKNGLFPQPIKLSSTVTVWKASDIHQWLAEHGEV